MKTYLTLSVASILFGIKAYSQSNFKQGSVDENCQIVSDLIGSGKFEEVKKYFGKEELYLDNGEINTSSRYFRNCYYPSAVKFYETQIKQNPNYILYRKLGEVKYLGGAIEIDNYKTSLPYFYKAAELNSLDTLTYLAITDCFQLLDVYRYNWGQQYTKTDSIKVSQLYLKFINDLGPTTGFGYFLYGEHFKSHNPKLAFSYYKKAYEIEPQNSKYNLTLGTITYKERDYKSALNYYLKALDRGTSEANYDVAKCYDNLGDYVNYKKYIDKAIELYPELKYKLETPLFKLKMEAGNSNSAEAFAEVANYYFNEDNFSTALRDLKKAAELGSTDGQVYFNIGFIYLEKSEKPNNDQAILYFKKALPLIKLSLDQITTYGNIGWAYENKDYQNAIVNYKKGVAIDPNYANNIYCKMYGLYQKMGDQKNTIYYGRLCN